MCCSSTNCLGIAQKSCSNSCSGMVCRRMFCVLDNSYFSLGNSPTFSELYQTRVTKTDCQVKTTVGPRHTRIQFHRSRCATTGETRCLLSHPQSLFQTSHSTCAKSNAHKLEHSIFLISITFVATQLAHAWSRPFV